MQEGFTCFMISNHRTRLDWMYLWSVGFRFGLLSSMKIVTKAELRKVPFIGWAMQMFGYLFLERKWEVDKQFISDTVTYFAESESTMSPLIFPEGTDLNEKSRAASHAYAEKVGAPKFEYVLLPRVAGFRHLLTQLGNDVHILMDITMAYKDYVRGERPNEASLIAGRFPKEVHIHIDMFPISDIPTGEEALAKWLVERWSKKEAVLKAFYEENKSFEGTPYRLPVIKKTMMLVAGLLQLVLHVMGGVALFTDAWWRWWFFGWTAVYFLCSQFGGIDKFNVWMHMFIRSKLPAHMRPKRGDLKAAQAKSIFKKIIAAKGQKSGSAQLSKPSQPSTTEVPGTVDSKKTQ
eukprot:CAMPEP_0175163770 /NCGR_PEP_ID=MMETSP0087-20121206/25971_1 /TAXON_ID=136419 /ORGANISM="Unknown Unknown, Strain D1" /LENGTH=347 /DNA_ID=CAMNT_0016452585 /DNA_START=226 /DNA_END=1269 /DNA_ORIENTATION=-